MKIGSKFLVAFIVCLLSSSVLLSNDGKIKVACIGDSITYGSGIEDRSKYSYPAQLQELLGDRYEVANFGKPGATLLMKGHRPYMKQEEFAQAMAFAGDIAVIHLGVNDTDPRNWPDYRDEFVSDYLALIDSLRSANPDVRVFVALTSPITSKHKRFISGTKMWQDQIQDEIRIAAAAAGAELLDFHTPMHSRPDLIPDSLHPVPEGAGMMAAIVYSAVTGDYGGLSMSQMYSDGMVIQRRKPVRINGTADAGKTVTVSFAGHDATVEVPSSGMWEVVFDGMEAATGLDLVISDGDSSLEYKDVAIGEVWLCSGQSNMAFMLKETGDTSSVNADPDLRFFDMKGRWNTNNSRWSDDAVAAVQRLNFYQKTSWTKCTDSTARSFSAVGYWYGRRLREALGVPVGLICNAVGGSTTESWIDRQTLETRFPAILKDWLKNDFIQSWARRRAARNIGAPESGVSRHPYEPCYLFESGILPLDRYSIAGVIWYQGESNAHNVEAHETLFELLVDSWRRHWNSPDMPFNFVQLSSINRPSWPHFRDSQRRLADRIPHVGMAVSSDVGDSLDVHPKNKRPVGERLAAISLHDTYGKKIEYSGPVFSKACLKKKRLFVEFTHSKGLRTSDGAAVGTFEIAGKDKIFHPVSAVIENGKVILDVQSMPHYIRYAWQPYTRANLVNSSGLPASTFCEKLK